MLHRNLFNIFLDNREISRIKFQHIKSSYVKSLNFPIKDYFYAKKEVILILIFQ